MKARKTAVEFSRCLVSIYFCLGYLYTLRPCRVSLQNMVSSVYEVLFINFPTVIYEVFNPPVVNVSVFGMAVT